MTATEISNIELCGFLINSVDAWSGDETQKMFYTKVKGKEYLLYENEYEVIPDNQLNSKNINKEITFIKNEMKSLSKRLDFLLKSKEEFKSLKEENVDLLTLKLYKLLVTNNSKNSYELAAQMKKEKQQ